MTQCLLILWSRKKISGLLAQGRELGAVWTFREENRISKFFHAGWLLERITVVKLTQNLSL